MFGTFYHSLVRKSVVTFGTLFNNIYIERSATGTETQKIKVPLSYASKERMFYRLNINASEPKYYATQIVLPRMSFAITSIAYDAERKRNIISKRYAVKDDQKIKYHHSEVPYNIGFSLYIYVKNVDDGLQILEQILPFFNPQFNITIKPDILGDVNELLDIPIVLNQVSPTEVYEGILKDDPSRIVVWELTFSAKIALYGPVHTNGLIKTADINIFDNIEGSLWDLEKMILK